MCKYSLVATISNHTDAVDAGGFQLGTFWRKTVTFEAEERDQVIALRDLLNSTTPALDPAGWPLWDQNLVMSNHSCWQWTLVSDNTTCLDRIMETTNIDTDIWAPGTTPSFNTPVITILLTVADGN